MMKEAEVELGRGRETTKCEGVFLLLLLLLLLLVFQRTDSKECLRRRDTIQEEEENQMLSHSQIPDSFSPFSHESFPLGQTRSRNERENPLEEEQPPEHYF